MSGTKFIWIACGALALGAAAVALLQPAPRDSRVPAPEPQRAPAAEVIATAPAADAAGSGAASVTAIAAPPAAGAPTAATAPRPAAGAAPVSAAASPLAAGALDLGLDRTIVHATILPGNIQRKTDATTGKSYLLADGKYEIRGAGTREDPYQVSWECLASASEVYLPRLHQETMPQRIALLDGAWIRIEGYLAFPLMLSETKEVLIMLNQWDGCCIGVPPTPYDAIEVKLAEVAKRTGRHATFNFGGVEGRLKVEPYLVESWLAGLYLLEDARMTAPPNPEL